jgi:hypothetical protein
MMGLERDGERERGRERKQGRGRTTDETIF